jgi:hypothetical protein
MKPKPRCAQRNVPELWLDPIPCNQRENARGHWAKGEVVAVLRLANSEARLSLLKNNADAMLEADFYEAALVEAYSGTSTNHYDLSPSELRSLFDRGSRVKLLDAGDPLPDAERFTVYRGVAGVEPHRREDGCSWSGDSGVAAWYAKRLQLQDPAVLQAQITRAEVYVYLAANGKGYGEEEFVCFPTAWNQLTTLPTSVDPAWRYRASTCCLRAMSRRGQRERGRRRNPGDDLGPRRRSPPGLSRAGAAAQRGAPE